MPTSAHLFLTNLLVLFTFYIFVAWIDYILQLCSLCQFSMPKVPARMSLTRAERVKDRTSTTRPSICLKFSFTRVLTVLVAITGAAGESIGSASVFALASASPRKIILINRNAETRQTVDGIESQFAINYVSHFLLTNLLIPSILAAGPGSRVVNVSSSAARHPTNLDFDDYNLSNGETYTAFDRYTQAKLAQVVFTIALAKKWRSTRSSPSRFIQALFPALCAHRQARNGNL